MILLISSIILFCMWCNVRIGGIEGDGAKNFGQLLHPAHHQIHIIQFLKTYSLWITSTLQRVQFLSSCVTLTSVETLVPLAFRFSFHKSIDLISSLLDLCRAKPLYAPSAWRQLLHPKVMGSASGCKGVWKVFLLRHHWVSNSRWSRAVREQRWVSRSRRSWTVRARQWVSRSRQSRAAREQWRVSSEGPFGPGLWGRGGGSARAGGPGPWGSGVRSEGAGGPARWGSSAINLDPGAKDGAVVLCQNRTFQVQWKKMWKGLIKCLPLKPYSFLTPYLCPVYLTAMLTLNLFSATTCLLILCTLITPQNWNLYSCFWSPRLVFPKTGPKHLYNSSNRLMHEVLKVTLLSDKISGYSSTKTLHFKRDFNEGRCITLSFYSASLCVFKQTDQEKKKVLYQFSERSKRYFFKPMP